MGLGDSRMSCRNTGERSLSVVVQRRITRLWGWGLLMELSEHQETVSIHFSAGFLTTLMGLWCWRLRILSVFVELLMLMQPTSRLGLKDGFCKGPVVQ